MNTFFRVGTMGLLLVAACSAALAGPVAGLESQEKDPLIGTEVSSGLPGVPGPYPNAGLGELDELVGDTMYVDFTWRDMQHNGSIGRMIAVQQVGDTTMVHFTYCKREDAGASSRQFHQAGKVDPDGNFTIDPFHTLPVDPTWGAYGVIGLDEQEAKPYMNYHGPFGSASYAVLLGWESAFIPGFYENYQVPPFDANTISMWPHMIMGRAGGSLYAHELLNGYNPDDDDNRLFYNRTMYDPATSAFTNATPGGMTQELVTQFAMNLSSVGAMSPDGNQVVFGQTASRWLQGEGPPDGQTPWTEKRASQVNNDIYIWESTDGGDTWDWDNPLNLTNWTPPDQSLLPDTVAASGDTLRAYTEMDFFVDDEGTIHVVFNAVPFVFWKVVANGGAVSFTSRLYYWNSTDQNFIQIADGTFWNGAAPAAWEQIVCHGNVYKDPETGILYVLYQQHGEPGWWEEDDEGNFVAYDATDDGIANADLYISASPDGGQRWTAGVNITQTHVLDPAELPLAAGESMSEREPSLARNNPGDWLNITYTLDRDGGIAEPSTAPDGDPTQNEIVYHRVSKSELLGLYDAYVPNYPMHMDSSGYWADPDDWAWDDPFAGYSVNEPGGALAPDQFELEANYPNPFNPSTKIAFRLQQAGSVQLTVYDVMGREVATLLNRPMEVGRHQVTFHAADLASGVYFYKLSSGEASQVRKMILMK